jgi:hypothetical protein
MASYGTPAGVAALCKHLTPAGDWSENKGPSSAQVTAWLEKGYGDINVRLAYAGYSVPETDTDILCYDTLKHLNDLYAAAVAELSWNVSRGEAEEEGRSARYWRMYLDGMRDLLAGDGTLVGLTFDGDARPRRRLRIANLRREDGYTVHADQIDTSDTLAAHIQIESGDPVVVE